MSFLQILALGFETYEANITLDLAGLLIEFILLFSVMNEIASGNRESRHFALVIFSVITALILNLLPCFTMAIPEMNVFSRWLISLNGTAVAFYIYSVSSYLISELKKRTFVYEEIYYTFALICGVAAIIWTVGTVADPSWFFTEDASGFLLPTALADLRFLFLFGTTLFCALLLLSCKRTIQNKDMTNWMFCLLMPLVFCVLPYSKQYIYHFGIAAATLTLYIGIDIERFHSIARSETKLTEMKTRLLISQIQPHFMYNALNSIYYLIGTDQEKAQEALSIFSDYLRRNVNSLKTEELVSIKNELEHVDAYLYLEKLRFGNKIHIVYDQQEMGFKVPALSVQPLVENAIKHGISKKKGGGTVTIATYKDDDNYYVSITDDGLGFSPKESKESGGTHTGVFNVANRIKTMSSGSLKVSSVPGEGTKCLITIPREAKNSVAEQ